MAGIDCYQQITTNLALFHNSVIKMALFFSFETKKGLKIF